MIKANELRIGNWVHCYNFTFRVLEITAIYVTDAPDGENGAFFFEKLEPIPLTTEILEACGFEKVSFTQWQNKEFKLTDVEEDGFLFCKIKSIEVVSTIKHLHQLQNLYFALTGEELEINL